MSRWQRIGAALLLVLTIGLLPVPRLGAQGPNAAAFVQFLQVAHTWLSMQTFNGGITVSSCTGCGGGNAITALTGNVVATGPGSVTATIQPGVVTNAMLAGSITGAKIIPGTANADRLCQVAGVLASCETGVATHNASTHTTISQNLQATGLSTTLATLTANVEGGEFQVWKNPNVANANGAPVSGTALLVTALTTTDLNPGFSSTWYTQSNLTFAGADANSFGNDIADLELATSTFNGTSEYYALDGYTNWVSGTGTLTSVEGVAAEVDVNNTGGTATAISALKTFFSGGGSTTNITSLRGLWVTAPSFASIGTVTTSVGLDIDNLTGSGTTVYGIRYNAPSAKTFAIKANGDPIIAGVDVGGLSTGLLLNTVSGGIPTLSQYAGTTCTNQVLTALSVSAAGTCTTITSAYVNNSIALTGTDINTSNQVTATHLAAGLPVNQGGTGGTSASITLFNNITGFTAAGTVAGATSTNLVFAGTTNADATHFLRGDGTWVVPAGGSPGGSSGDVQCNVAAAFGACDTGIMTYAGHILTVNTINSNQNSALALAALAPTQVSASVIGNNASFAASNATAGSSSAGTAAGGAVSITAGNAAGLTSGQSAGGAITITSGTAVSISNNNGAAGGNLTLTAGLGASQGVGSGPGGTLALNGGTATGNGLGGIVNINGGPSASAAGGAINITGGAPTSGNPAGGAVTISGGAGFGGGAGGAVLITTATGVSTGVTGTMTISTGSSASGQPVTPGAMTISVGAPGNAGGGNGAAGAAMTLTAGPGGATSTAGGAVGGNGAALNLNGGAGGAKAASGANAGNGGNVAIAAGAGGAGSGGAANGLAGLITLGSVTESIGTKPVVSGCSAGTQTGGAMAGTFSSGTTGTCSITLTWLPTAATGYTCTFVDVTTSVDATSMQMTGGTTTTITASGTTVSGDVIRFFCMAY